MRTAIYYFTGTGNSLAVAKDIAQRLGSSLIPIASLRKQETITTEAEVIGIVFPVYYGELPILVKEFAKKLQNVQYKYIFAVCTYGGAAMASLRSLKHILRSNKYELSAAYGVHMPQNSFPKSSENYPKIYAEWKNKLELIAHNTQAKVKGVFYSNIALELLMIPMQPLLIRPMCRKSFVKQTNMPPDTTMDALVRRMDSGFVTNERCNGCGTCEKVCPVGNIRMEEGKPVWQHHCETCLACYNWCPNKAIEGGVAAKGYYYRHPEVGVGEMMGERGKV